MCKSNGTKKLALHFLDMTLLKAHVLYVMQNEKSMPLLHFKMSIIIELTEKINKEDGHPGMEGVQGKKNPQHLTACHFPAYEPTASYLVNTVRKCHVCTPIIINCKATCTPSTLRLACCV
jgi:hypothetical protein